MECNVMSIGGSMLALALVVALGLVVVFGVGYLLWKLVKCGWNVCKAGSLRKEWGRVKAGFVEVGIPILATALGVALVVALGCLLIFGVGWLGCYFDLAPWLDKMGMVT